MLSKKSCDYLLIFIKQKLRNSKFRKKVRIARYKCRIVKGKKFYPSTNRKKINMLNCSTHNTSNDLSYLTTARLQKKYREHHITIQEISTRTAVCHITHNSAPSLRNTPKHLAYGSKPAQGSLICNALLVLLQYLFYLLHARHPGRVLTELFPRGEPQSLEKTLF